MKRASLIVAGLLCFGISVSESPKAVKGQRPRPPAKPLSSEWTKIPFDPTAIAKRFQQTLFSNTFSNVHLATDLQIRCPLSPSIDPKGYGVGQEITNSFIWNPKKFQLEFLVYYPHSTKAHPEFAMGVPTSEHLVFDGTGKMLRFGLTVGANMNFKTGLPLFNVGSDAQLVETWPSQFPRYLLSPLAKGNATPARYVAALLKGVGGYKVSTWERSIREKGRDAIQFRILAERPKRPNLPQSRVEMIFMDVPRLPVKIETILGPPANPKYHLLWSGTWYNHSKSMPRRPVDIGFKPKG